MRILVVEDDGRLGPETVAVPSRAWATRTIWSNSSATFWTTHTGLQAHAFSDCEKRCQRIACHHSRRWTGFEPTNSPSLTSNDEKSTKQNGLGIAIAQEIVNAYGGALTFTPNDPAGGLVVVVRLPSRSREEPDGRTQG